MVPTVHLGKAKRQVTELMSQINRQRTVLKEKMHKSDFGHLLVVKSEATGSLKKGLGIKGAFARLAEAL